MGHPVPVSMLPPLKLSRPNQAAFLFTNTQGYMAESIYDIESVEAKAKRAAKQLPDPQGYRILLALPEVKKKTDGGIIRPDEYVGKEAQASIIGFVMKKGPDCYADKTRFPSGAWCEEGDWVIFRAYSGTRVRIHGQTFCMINDDTVEAVVESPSGIERSI